ncbi:uncharacterized protein HGUI_00697 [Hanseniaspora guilliermondii]|uniref:Uncharacterized protein n=1 Tax=Hanseniaspora guilliermondii TaxID=56406 RepID=A0A1L0CJH2_9ASCO|nr:uncharacterized protein HGUI_00697 [Hanseniaspora guilliermondii]
MATRNLSEIERWFAEETFQSKRNGIVSASVYTSREEEEMLKDDTATLSSVKTVRLAGGEKCALIKLALKYLIEENIILQLTLNADAKLQSLEKIFVNDVLTKLDFPSLVDEKIECYHSLPLPLLKEIFNNEPFLINKPLWRLFLIDENMLIFHGNETIFDAFSMMNMQRAMQIAINRAKHDLINISENMEVIDTLFINRDYRNLKIPKSVYDSSKLFIPSIGKDILNSQTQFFFKKIYTEGIKKSIDILRGYQPTNHLQIHNLYNQYSDLCGNSVFGNISTDKYKRLKKFLYNEDISLKSFIATIVMMCLDVSKSSEQSDILFQFPYNLRKVSKSELDLLSFKNILVKCPVSYVTSKNFLDFDFYNGYDANNVRFPLEDPEFKEKLLDFNFEHISKLFETSIRARINAWNRCGLNDDDIKRMKMAASNTYLIDKVIEINDLVEESLEIPKESNYMLKDAFFVKSSNPHAFLTVSLTSTQMNGLNITLTYPEGYEMDEFILKFEDTIDLACGN